LFTRKTEMVAPDHALPGRDTPVAIPGTHLVLGTPIGPPVPRRNGAGDLRDGLLLGSR